MRDNGIGTLDFSASRGEVTGERIEHKVCELCERMFYRPQPLNARLGQKHCAVCVKRLVDAAMAPIPKASDDIRHAARRRAEWVLN